MNFSKSTPAFEHLFKLAGYRYDVLERALTATCTHVDRYGATVSRFDDVVKYLEMKK